MRGRSGKKFWTLLVSAALLCTSPMPAGADSAAVTAEAAEMVTEQADPVPAQDETQEGQDVMDQTEDVPSDSEGADTASPQPADPEPASVPEGETDSVSSAPTSSGVVPAPAESDSLKMSEENQTSEDSQKKNADLTAVLNIPESLPSSRMMSVQILWGADEAEEKPESVKCTVFSDQSEEPLAAYSISDADAAETEDGTLMWSKTLPDPFPVYSKQGNVISYRIVAVDSDGRKYSVHTKESRNLYQDLNFYIPSDSLEEGDEYLLASAGQGKVSLYTSAVNEGEQTEKVSAGVISGEGYTALDQNGRSSQNYIAIRTRSQETDESTYASALSQITWLAQKDASGALILVNRASGEVLADPLQDGRCILFERIVPKEMPEESAKSEFTLTRQENDLQDAEEAESDAESAENPMETDFTPAMGLSRAAALTGADSINQAPDVVGDIKMATDWQIVSQRYAGTDQEDKTGYDIDQDGSEDVFYQKNVIPTGIENEFRVYMGITKRMTWDELLAESDFAVSNSNGFHGASIGTLYPDISKGKKSWLYAGRGSRNLEATVNYFRGGKIIHTYKGWYHYTTTPTASNGTGFIYLKSLGQYLLAAKTIALSADKNGGSVNFDIDLDAMARQNIYFSVDDIVVDSVQDQMGGYITYEKAEMSDGETGLSGNTLTWRPESNGASGVQVLENGGLTGYHYNIHQMVYDVHLKAEQEGFQSCAQNMDSKVGDPESYRVNQQAVLKCHIGSSSGSPAFQVPYVRGLLYDLEFRKIVKDTQIPLKDISFTVTRQTGGNTAAEQLKKTDRQTTDSDGWIKFHNLPWGNYSLQELAGKEGSFQSEYLDESGLDQPVSVQIGKVINEPALSQDHGSGHSVDRESDVRNMLVLYNGTGIFENSLNTAKITFRKVVREYDTLPDDLKNQAYTINMGTCISPHNPNRVYEMPKPGDTELKEFEQEPELHHGDAVEYTLVVPKTGYEITFNEENLYLRLKKRMEFDSVKIEKNESSTDIAFDESEIDDRDSWQTIPISPGNDLTVTYTNRPIGYVKIKKVVDNEQDQLAGDAFIIKVTSAEDQGQTVNAQVVLSHREESGWIPIEKTTTLRIDEILPKEYSKSGITVDGGGTLEGDKVIVHPGEVVEIGVHNQYTGKPFFHASDAVKNRFHPILQE